MHHIQDETCTQTVSESMNRLITILIESTGNLNYDSKLEAFTMIMGVYIRALDVISSL